MKQYLNKLIGCAVICGLFLGIASIGECKLQSQEWKLQLNPAVFAADREAGYTLLQGRMAAAASATEISASFAADKEKCRLIRYFDTVNRDLSQQHYILRQRIRVKNGAAREFGDLTLKLRLQTKDATAAQAAALLTAGAAKVKVEADTLGYLDRQAGKSQTLVSISATRKAIPALETLSAELAREYFPTLLAEITADLGITSQSLEYSRDLGEVTDKSLKPFVVSVAVWYDPTTEVILLAEISWKAAADNQAAKQLFYAMQEGNEDILMAGQAKTARLTE